jgi:hypothetical protein
MLDFFTTHLDTILTIVVLLVGLAYVVTKLTPGTTDDEWALKVKTMVEEAVEKFRAPKA